MANPKRPSVCFQEIGDGDGENGELSFLVKKRKILILGTFLYLG